MFGLSQALTGLLLLLALEQPATDQISFNLPLSEGTVAGTAGAIEYSPDGTAALTGGVEILFRDMKIQADRIELDREKQTVWAGGNVIFDQGPNRMNSSTMEWSLETDSGILTQAYAQTEGDIYFSGDRMEKTVEGEWIVEDGIFTSCDGEVPAWSFRLRKGRIEEEGYARLHGVSMRAKKMPVAYLPYLLWPTKTERVSGFLVPKLGYSNLRGGYLGMAYYKTLGPSADATLFADLYSKDYFGGGLEVRYQPTEGTKGEFRGYVIEDPEADELRWKLRLNHRTTDLPLGFRGVINYEDYSDFQFFRDFERSLDRKAKRHLYSNAYLSRNAGPHSLNIMVDKRETFLSSGSTITLEQLPEIEYRLRPIQLGQLPLYFQLDSSAHSLSVDRSETYQGDFGRVDLFPRIRVPLASLPWLSFSLDAGVRGTWYGDSITKEGGDTSFTGESLTRVIPLGGAEIVGPSFSRIFERSTEGFSKFKHIIEPRIRYAYQDEFDEEDEIPLFDSVDRVFGSHSVQIFLTNRILAKPLDGGGSREILSLELSRRYSLDEKNLERGNQEVLQDDGTFEDETVTSKGGPIKMSLRSYPSRQFGLRLDSTYSMLFNQFTSLRLATDFSLGKQARLSLGWTPRYQADTGETLSDQATLSFLTPIIPNKLTWRAAFSYDIERSLMRDQRHFLSFKGSCYTFRLEYHESHVGDFRRRDYLFSVDLKNIGTFLDISGGDSEDFD